MIEKWTTLDWQEFPMVLVCGVVTYAAIILFTRIAGLRSFSKMSAADFAVTVAVGSLFASTIATPSPSLIMGIFALAFLFAGQWLVSLLRHRFGWFSQLIDNEPLLLMKGNTFLDENLKRANVTRADIYGKLREANAINYDEVLAVVFEGTGDVSVLHSRDADVQLEPDFLQDVIGAEQHFDLKNRIDPSPP